MVTFAGSITFDWEINAQDILFAHVSNSCSLGKNIFIYGETQFTSSGEIIDFIKQRIVGNILSVDISIETEDVIEVMTREHVLGKYHFIAFHGMTMQDVSEEARQLSGNIISIREAEESDKLGWRVIKVDIISE